MKKTMTIIVAVLFALSLDSFSFAAVKAAEQKAPVPAKAETKAQPSEMKAAEKAMQVTGDVKSIDVKAKTITIAKKKGDKTVETVVTLGEKTKIMSGKDEKKLTDVKAGDKIRVKYTEADGKKIAKMVAIIPAVAMAPVEKKAEPAKATKPAEKK